MQALAIGKPLELMWYRLIMSPRSVDEVYQVPCRLSMVINTGHCPATYSSRAIFYFLAATYNCNTRKVGTHALHPNHTPQELQLQLQTALYMSSKAEILADRCCGSGATQPRRAKSAKSTTLVGYLQSLQHKLLLALLCSDLAGKRDKAKA